MMPDCKAPILLVDCNQSALDGFPAAQGLALRSFGAWACSGKLLGMLVATAAPVGNALSLQDGDVALDTSLHRTPGEIAVMLAVTLAVENRRA